MIQYLLHEPPDLLAFLIAALAAAVAISCHEFAHAAAARWQGDPTAKLAGRLTLDPRPHLDPVGSFMILLVGFGWGKPVPVAENKLRSGKLGVVLVALAGPAANLVLAFGSGVLLSLAGPTGSLRTQELILIPFSLNIMIALFNLLPVPPLDGFPILARFLPRRRYEVLAFLERWSFIILIVAAFLLFRPIARPFAGLLGQALLRLAGATG